ncbi:MAG TPA: ABC transporter ATP-binding protein [Treponema sp.]|nr:ABC transporter ATP-binding protein [Treponema sp.]HZK01979.1 ABC transporter ATP-binding protein [Anaerovoracaceae bacterium]
MLISLKNVSKTYMMDKIEIPALKNVNLDINTGDFVCLMGPSGSGKSTMLHVIGCIENQTSGDMIITGENTKTMNDTALSKFRNRHIGFIFQSFNLISVLNVRENVEYPLVIRGGKINRSHVESVIESVGLADYMKHRPDELSGGQRQRVAIARALVTNPDIIIADEPTANLDSKTGGKIIDLLMQLNSDSNTTFIFSTHNESLSKFAKRTIHILDGEIVSA